MSMTAPLFHPSLPTPLRNICCLELSEWPSPLFLNRGSPIAHSCTKTVRRSKHRYQAPKMTLQLVDLHKPSPQSP
ncbi:hypothetical protein VIGAN_03097100, partial [Vigna angularis var. angularis]